MVAGGGDIEGVALFFVGDVVGIPDVADGRDGDDDKQEDGEGDQADLDQRIAVALRRRLGLLGVLRLGAELDLGVGQDSSNHDEDEGRHVDRDHEQVPLPGGDGARGDHGGLGAAEAEDLVQLVAAGEQDQAEAGKKSGGKAENFAVNGTCAGHV